MRFILFNIVVAAGLFFLFTQGEPGDAGAPNVFPGAVLKATEIGETLVEKFAGTDGPQRDHAAPPGEPQAPMSTAGKDQPQGEEPKEVKKPAPPPGPRAMAEGSDDAPPSPAAADDGPVPVIAAAERPAHPVPEGRMVADLDPEVLRRRAEVLGQDPGQPRFAIEDGRRMMTPAERRRELEALVERMELFYLGRVGD